MAAGAAVITVAEPERTDQPRSSRNASVALSRGRPRGNAAAIIAGRPRARYQSRTSAVAAASGRPGSPTASALFARPVKPSAARSSKPPSAASSAGRQPPAAAASSAGIEIATMTGKPPRSRRGSEPGPGRSVSAMNITVLGGSGAWPTPRQACSGYLAESDGFLLLIDPGYASLPRLLEHTAASAVDAVLVSHGHPDHCADLNPLLRARALSEDPPGPMPVHALPGAVGAVLALDAPGTLAGSYVLRNFTAPGRFSIGPFDVGSWMLPHFVPNAGLRLTAGGTVLAYTGDTGPSPDIVTLARDADLLLAEATYPYVVPADSAAYLSSAVAAGQNAARAGAAASCSPICGQARIRRRQRGQPPRPSTGPPRSPGLGSP